MHLPRGAVAVGRRPAQRLAAPGRHGARRGRRSASRCSSCRVRAGMPDRQAQRRAVRVRRHSRTSSTGARRSGRSFPSVVATLVAAPSSTSRGVPVHLPDRGLHLDVRLGPRRRAAYGILVRRKWFVVRRARGHASTASTRRFDGLRIAHLSDLHIGTLHAARAGATRGPARRERAATPDLAVVTGDWSRAATTSTRTSPRSSAASARRTGVFVSMGNHDYFGDAEPLVTLLARAGRECSGTRGSRSSAAGSVALPRGHRRHLDEQRRHGPGAASAARRRPGRPARPRPRARSARPPRRERRPHAERPHPRRADCGPVPRARRSPREPDAPYIHRASTVREAALYVHPGLGTTGPPMRLGVAPAV